METSHTRIHPGETDASCVTVIAWRFCADAAPWMISMMMTQGKGKTGHPPHEGKGPLWTRRSEHSVLKRSIAKDNRIPGEAFLCIPGWYAYPGAADGSKNSLASYLVWMMGDAGVAMHG
eukprot:1260401-Rhodomonas_salina.1